MMIGSRAFAGTLVGLLVGTGVGVWVGMGVLNASGLAVGATQSTPTR